MSAESPSGDQPVGFDVSMQVPLQLTAELGARRMALADILKIGTGSIVELDRSTSDPVDVLAAGTLIGRGEIVAIGDRFGVRVTELAGRTTRPPAE